MKTTQKRLIAISMAVTAITTSAFADRNMTSPTQHQYASNATEAEINEIINRGYRMHDVEVTSTSPYRFAGSFVKNTGMYASGWWWTANKSAAGLTQFYNSRNARIIDLEVNIVNGQKKFAATFVKNTGSDYKNWSWFDNATFDQMNAHADATNQRVVDVDVYMVGNERRFAGVMIKDTGTDELDSWVFSNITRAQVSQLLSQKKARLTDIERITDDRYAGIAVKGEGQMWWWNTDRSWADIQFAVAQCGARVIDIERYTKNGSTFFNYVLINNSNELESRIGNLLRTNSDGIRGFILKQLNGPVLGGLLENTTFYPASTIKVLEHFYWTRRINNGLNSQTSVNRYTDHTSDTHPNNGSTIASSGTLQSFMQNMMFNSNNQDTNALQDFAGSGNGVTGRTNINSFGKNTLGLSDSFKLNHKFGALGAASPTPNVATLSQFSKLYEKYADGSVLNFNGRNFFRQNMLNETSNSNFRNGVRTVINEEGASLGKSAATITAFRNQVLMCWKPGNWNSATNHVSSAGWIQLPYNGGLQTKQFTLGAFVDNYSFTNLNMSLDVLPEIIRDEIREALASW